MIDASISPRERTVPESSIADSQRLQLLAVNRELSRLLVESNRSAAEALRSRVCMERLFGARNVDDAIRAIEEILISALGTEDFVILSIKDDEFEPIGGAGPSYAAAQANHPVLPQLVNNLTCSDEPTAIRWFGSGQVAVCVPLCIDARIVGAVCIARFLTQCAEPADRNDDVLNVLRRFGGLAIAAAAARPEWSQLAVEA